jgi:hypothetical protein
MQSVTLYRLWVLLYTDGWCGTCLSAYTPFGYLAVHLLPENQQLPVSPEVLQLFFNQVFHGPVLQAHLCKHFL